MCDCGAVKDVDQWALKKGGTRSCGCIQKERATAMCKKRALPNGEAARNDVIYKYKLRAKKENIEWKLTDEQCEKFFKGDCAYCGTEPQREKKLNYSSTYVYNGIDRIDNQKGYTVENSVSCCMRCNYMKSNLSLADFYEHIKKIYERLS